MATGENERDHDRCEGKLRCGQLEQELLRALWDEGITSGKVEQLDITATKNEGRRRLARGKRVESVFHARSVGEGRVACLSVSDS